MNLIKDVAVIFGSALTPGATPRDIDVAFAGDKQRAVAAAQEWAEKRGLGGLPIDAHRANHGWSHLTLPVPCWTEGRYEALYGAPEVYWERHHGLAAHIRAYQDPDELSRRLGEIRHFPIAVVPAPGERGDFQDYTEGLLALRSALEKNPAARGVVARRWPLLERLLEQESPGFRFKNRRTVIARSSGAVVLVLDAKPRRFGGRGRVTTERPDGPSERALARALRQASR